MLGHGCLCMLELASYQCCQWPKGLEISCSLPSKEDNLYMAFGNWYNVIFSTRKKSCHFRNNYFLFQNIDWNNLILRSKCFREYWLILNHKLMTLKSNKLPYNLIQLHDNIILIWFWRNASYLSFINQVETCR